MLMSDETQNYNLEEFVERIHKSNFHLKKKIMNMLLLLK